MSELADVLLRGLVITVGLVALTVGVVLVYFSVRGEEWKD